MTAQRGENKEYPSSPEHDTKSWWYLGNKFEDDN